MTANDIIQILSDLGKVYGNFFDYISIPLVHFGLAIIVVFGVISLLFAIAARLSRKEN